MAKHPSAERQHRTSLRKNAVNKKNKSALRTQVKKLRGLIEAGDKERGQESPSVGRQGHRSNGEEGNHPQQHGFPV